MTCRESGSSCTVPNCFDVPGQVSLICKLEKNIQVRVEIQKIIIFMCGGILSFRTNMGYKCKN